MKYIGFYDSDLNLNENRITHMSAKNKMDYISTSLNELDLEVDIISPSWTLNKKFYSEKKIKIKEKTTLILGPTLPYIKGVTHIFSTLWLIYYLLKNMDRGETVIVYHSLALMFPMRIINFLKKSNIILEVEEIYSDVIEKNKRYYNSEMDFINDAKFRILVSQKLYNRIGKDNDTILYGSYFDNVRPSINKTPKSLVYAGIIDRLKGGAFLAVDMMKHIEDNEITLSILGTGTQIDLVELEKRIVAVNNQKGKEAVRYLGKMSGEEYHQIMNKFQYGLNIQNEGEYMNSAFPSKIIAYLSYGLNVISSNIDSIVESPFSKGIDFVNMGKSSNVARQVERIVTPKKNETSLKRVNLQEYHSDFKDSLSDMLNLI